MLQILAILLRKKNILEILFNELRTSFHDIPLIFIDIKGIWYQLIWYWHLLHRIPKLPRSQWNWRKNGEKIVRWLIPGNWVKVNSNCELLVCVPQFTLTLYSTHIDRNLRIEKYRNHFSLSIGDSKKLQAHKLMLSFKIIQIKGWCSAFQKV